MLKGLWSFSSAMAPRTLIQAIPSEVLSFLGVLKEKFLLEQLSFLGQDIPGFTVKYIPQIADLQLEKPKKKG